MAELENEDINTDDVNTEIDSQQDEGDIDIDTTDEVTYEQAMAWKKEAERLSKAEKKVVELKKQLKKTPISKEVDTSKYITKEDLALEKFIATKPELEEYKEELTKYVTSGLSLKQAAMLVENDDKTIANRKKSNSLNIVEGEAPSKTQYSVAELEKMKQVDYNKVMGLIESGKATLG